MDAILAAYCAVSWAKSYNKISSQSAAVCKRIIDRAPHESLHSILRSYQILQHHAARHAGTKLRKSVKRVTLHSDVKAEFSSALYILEAILLYCSGTTLRLTSPRFHRCKSTLTGLAFRKLASDLDRGFLTHSSLFSGAIDKMGTGRYSVSDPNDQGCATPRRHRGVSPGYSNNTPGVSCRIPPCAAVDSKGAWQTRCKESPLRSKHHNDGFKQNIVRHFLLSTCLSL